ncbi:TetR/AcrR family transcriptional regulator [Flavihumibacter sp. CACIAM 22H1]|uniref:TetR/AcrR family transcriptional regulator n=1 Tax=Flavihumibacter sp. CACIAM 22H1 TaxID=1812911 RepID=UPI0025C3B71D|nr:TetR/AcrR family transcriptional regulator [Flavihumibacter sp. CACIAM 22H1]
MDKREQIILAAMKLLCEKGVQATPMSAIAKAANTGMGTIYNYFPTKEALINGIYLHIKTAEILVMDTALDETKSLKLRFFHFYTAFVHYYLKYPYSFAFMDQFHSSPVILEETREAGKANFLPVIELLTDGQKQGLIKEMELESLLQFLSGTINTFVRWLQTKPAKQREVLLKQQLRMVWDAIKE